MPNRLRGLLAWSLLLLAACGGGGGGGGGGSPPAEQPRITATLISFPTGAVPPGFTSGSANTLAVVEVRNQADTAPISTATVSVNGTALTYYSGDEDYAAELTIAPGQEVALTVVVNGTSYTASHTQFNTYPTIYAPAANATWDAGANNTIGWSGVGPSGTAQYALGVLAPDGSLIWPADGGLQLVAASETSYQVPANSVSTGSRLVFVGIVEAVSIPGAVNGSGLLLSGFNYVPVTVNAPVSATQTGLSTPATGVVGVGTSLQLTATAQYSDGTTQDRTGSAQWSSSDTAKVSVSSTGLVTGVAGGVATISAQFGGFTASTQVTVFSPVASPAPPLGQAFNYQIDYAHSGFVTFGGAGPTFPETAHWTQTLNGQASYPLIVDGRVFVLSNSTGGAAAGSSLYALDLTTGNVLWGPIALPGTYPIAGHTYDHGKVFVVNVDGVLSSFDAATGAAGWSVSLPYQYLFTSPPTAYGGLVYVVGAGSGGTLYAVDQGSGGVLWTAPVANGDHSAPTVSASGVYVSFPCQVYSFQPWSGVAQWHYNGGCSGGGGKTTVLAGGRLYVRDPPNRMIFDASNGNSLGSFNASVAPAFSSQAGFFLNGGTLSAISLSTSDTLWTFDGDGGLVTAPVVIDSAVVIGSSSGMVYALDATTGALLWSASAGTAIFGPDEQNATAALTGLGAGEGYLIVPAGNTVQGWRLKP